MRTSGDRNLRFQLNKSLASLKVKFTHLDDFHSLIPQVHFQHYNQDIVSYCIRPKAKVSPYEYMISFEVNFKTGQVLYYSAAVESFYSGIEISEQVLKALTGFEFKA